MSDPTDNTRPGPVEPYYADFPEQESPDDVADVEPVAPKPPRLRVAAIVGARVIAGSAGIVIAAATIAAAALIPIPNVRSTPVTTEITPVATAQQLVCPGGLLRLSDSTGADASTASSLGQAGITSAATVGVPEQSPFGESEAGTGGSTDAPQLLTAEPDPNNPTIPVLVSGAQAQALITGEATGLSAAACDAASGNTWLVGGATATGRTTLLTLSNPSEVAATVDLEVFGELGTVTAPGMTGIAVPPNSQTVLSLAGFAPGVTSPVVHVQSRGGLIVATLQQSITRGITPGGVDVVGASAAPSNEIVIPGVVIANTAAIGARLGESGYEDLKAALRVYIPEEGETSVEVDVQPEDDAGTGTSFTLDVVGGVVSDLPLDDIGDGSYTVSVKTASPAVAAVRTSAIGSPEVGGRTDLAWLTSAARITSDVLVSAPAGVTTGLHLANRTGADAVVTISALDADTITVVIPAGAATSVPIAAGQSYRIGGFTELYASVSASYDGGVAGFTVVPPARASNPVLVYP